MSKRSQTLEGVGASISNVLAALKVCSRDKNLQTGKQIHSLVNQSGDYANVYVANTLLDMYAKCGCLMDARRVFDRMVCHSAASWNAIIMGYAKSGSFQLSFQLYFSMQEQGCIPDRFTFLAVLKACARLTDFEEGNEIEGKLVKSESLRIGRAIHSEALKTGHDSDIYISTSLVDMYSKCRSMVDAQSVFDKMVHHPVASWTAIILGYTNNGECDMALHLYTLMQDQGCSPDRVLFIPALKACSNLAAKEEGKAFEGRLLKVGCLQRGRAVHADILKAGYDSHIYISAGLIDMYAKCGSMKDARKVFDHMEYHDVVTWNAIIMGYASTGEAGLAFHFYLRMKDIGFLPDAITFIGALKACSTLLVPDIGRLIHMEICEAKLQYDPFVVTCLVDFYGKCGSMMEAQQVFDSVIVKKLVTWNALLAGYSRNGYFHAAFELFDRMRKEQLQIDGVTFLSLLIVCSHAGLIQKGIEYFKSMWWEYGIFPGIEHYGCMIDLLGRANQLEDAVILVNSITCNPDFVIWKMILSAGHKSKDNNVVDLASESLRRLNR